MPAACDLLINLTPHRQGRLRLLCLPFAGGGSGAFHDWPAQLPSDVDVWAVRLPGRESRLLEEPYRELHTLIKALAPAVGPLTRTPYALFGHSMGALIGYELARALLAAGRPAPTWLIASGHEAPHVVHYPKQLHRMPDDRLIETLRDYGATPDTLLSQPELLELFLPTIRADFAVVETYVHQPGPPLPCPIAVFRGVTDAEVSPQGCVAWAELTSAACVQRCFPGGHFFIDDVRDLVLAELAALVCDSGGNRLVA